MAILRDLSIWYSFLNIFIMFQALYEPRFSRKKAVIISTSVMIPLIAANFALFLLLGYEGYGTLMLSQALPYAKALGIARCLITCDDDNPGSARVMEKNGFTLGDKVPNVIDGQAIITRRYWKEL